MRFPILGGIPSSKQLVRTVFWTLWLITIALTSYAFCVETFGNGLFLRDDPGPKLHMRGEVHLAFVVNTSALVGLTIVTLISWSIPLVRLCLAAILYFGCYLAIPRF